MLSLASSALALTNPTGLTTTGLSTPTTTATPFSDRTNIGTLEVPRIGIGTIAWTDDTPEDFERIANVANTAVSEGLTFFDTAERYGAKGTDLIPAALAAVGLPVENDYLGGDTETNLQQWVGERGAVATKFAPTPWRNDAQSVVDACQGSCERLGVESVDLMQIHMPDIIQPFKAFGVESRNEEAHWDGLARCYHEGLAKNVGVSNYGPTLLKRAHAHLAARGVPLASNQICFNLLYRRQGSLATVEACNELGVACLAYYPLAMGLLTGKLTPQSLAGRTDTRAKELVRYLEGGAPLNPLDTWPGTAGVVPEGGIRPVLIALQDVSRRCGKTPAQVALNWVVCKGALPLAGASSALQVRENAGALGWRLDPEDVAQLDTAADSLPFEFRGSGFQTVDSKFVGYGFEQWRLD